MSFRSLFAAAFCIYFVQNADAQAVAIPEIAGGYSCTADGTGEVIQITLNTERNRLKIDGIDWRERVSLASDDFSNGLPCENGYFAGLGPTVSAGEHDTVEKNAKCDADSITVSSGLERVTKNLFLIKSTETFDFDFAAKKTGPQSVSLSFATVLKTDGVVRGRAKLLLACSKI